MGHCLKFAEKTVLSHCALVGVHYFRNRKVFLDAYNDMVKKNERAPNGEFYMSLMYNSIIRNGGTVVNVPMKPDEVFYPTGEPHDYFKYCNAVTKFGPRNVSNKEGILVSLPDLFVQINSTSNRAGSDLAKNTLCVKLDEPEFGRIDRYAGNFAHMIVRSSILTGLENKGDSPRRGNQMIASTNDMTRGWFIGNFEPSILKTDKFEIGVLHHKAGEKWPFHIHDESVEYNALISGSMNLNGTIYNSGDFFLFDKGHPAVPIFLTDCIVVCVKVPSAPSDKRVI